MTSLLGLLARRYAVWTTTWLFIVGTLVVGTLVVVTLPAYASTYPDDSARRVAVALAQNNAATTLLYGRLADPGSPGQMFGWEIGTCVTLLVAVLGVLMAVRLTRVAEQEGTIEIIHSAGLGRLAPLTATFVVLAVVGAILGLVSAPGVGFRAGQVDGVDWTGALAFGSVVALTFVLMALIAVILAQLLPTAWSARVAGARPWPAASPSEPRPTPRTTPGSTGSPPGSAGHRGAVHLQQPHAAGRLIRGRDPARRCRDSPRAFTRARREHPAGFDDQGSPRPGVVGSGSGLAPGPSHDRLVGRGDRPRWGTIYRDGVERGEDRASGPAVGWVPRGTARRRRPRLGLLRMHRHGRRRRRRGVGLPFRARGGHGGTSRTR